MHIGPAAVYVVDSVNTVLGATLTQDHIKAIADHIQSTVAVLNPHGDTRLNTLYTQGFILGHLASIFSNDAILYREFLEHCEHLAKTHNKKIDTHRK